ncbi:hypothetical protein ABIC99_002106 [Sphaerotilus sulfidivorans]|uniref:7TM-DISM receptor extracellular domain-containing protein n=1 Tax=Sphaerotilus sulfidivorans TaxID=639200 RepID=A0ABV2IMX1_9BURK|nr:hypothetical protein [Sphaerotilus sulfidivorans]NZD47713.1 hypothetical protein [Sphaerotilus sulfidivorans]
MIHRSSRLWGRAHPVLASWLAILVWALATTSNAVGSPAFLPERDSPVDLSSGLASGHEGRFDLTESMRVLMQPAAAVSAEHEVLRQPGWRPATLANRNGLWKNATLWLTASLTNGAGQPLHRLVVLRGWRIARPFAPR